MSRTRSLLLCSFVFIIFLNIYSNDFGDEANYILQNRVEISIIDSFYYNVINVLPEYNVHLHNGGRRPVAMHLLNYIDEEAINLFLKLLKDYRFEYQNYSIFPLINAGKFDIAFSKYKELVLNNKIDIILNFYRGQINPFHNKQFILYKKYKKDFIPFLKKVCLIDTITYEIRFDASKTLYYLGEKDELINLSKEILENVPNPDDGIKNRNDYSDNERRNRLIRHKAENSLKNLKLD